MAKGAANPKVDQYLERSGRWRAEQAALREIVRGCDLEEEFKWGVPCYTHDGDNVVLMHEFKDYCALLFFKGALLKDPNGVLVQQTKNTQAARQIRFTNVREVAELAPVLKAYIGQAIEVQKAGLKVDFKPTAEFAVPEEFRRTLEQRADVKAAFESLTPGRQRAYLLHFAAPKQARTREARVEKCTPQILAGKGLND